VGIRSRGVFGNGRAPAVLALESGSRERGPVSRNSHVAASCSQAANPVNVKIERRAARNPRGPRKTPNATRSPKRGPRRKVPQTHVVSPSSSGAFSSGLYSSKFLFRGGRFFLRPRILALNPSRTDAPPTAYIRFPSNHATSQIRRAASPRARQGHRVGNSSSSPVSQYNQINHAKVPQEAATR